MFGVGYRLFLKKKFTLESIARWVSAATTARKVIIHRTQEASSVEDNSVVNVGSNSWSLSPGGSFSAYLGTAQFDENFPNANLVPCAQ